MKICNGRILKSKSKYMELLLSWLPLLLVLNLAVVAAPLAFYHRRATVAIRAQSGDEKVWGLVFPTDTHVLLHGQSNLDAAVAIRFPIPFCSECCG